MPSWRINKNRNMPRIKSGGGIERIVYSFTTHYKQARTMFPACFVYYFKKILLYYFYILNNISSFVPELTIPTYETTDYTLLLLSESPKAALGQAVSQ